MPERLQTSVEDLQEEVVVLTNGSDVDILSI